MGKNPGDLGEWAYLKHLKIAREWPYFMRNIFPLGVASDPREDTAQPLASHDLDASHAHVKDDGSIQSIPYFILKRSFRMH